MQQTRPTADTFVGAILLLVISVFISYVDRGNLSVAAPLLKTELSLSASQLGLLLSAFFWSYTGMLFVCASFMDRWDVTRVLPVGFLVWCIATAAMGFVSGFAMMFIMRLLLGIGESVTFPSYSKILAQCLPEERRGFANAAIIAGMKLGPAAGTLLVGLLIAEYGWRPVFIGLGLVGLLWLPAWAKWRPRVFATERSRGPAPSITLLVQQRAFWATVAGGFCVAYPLYFMVTWLPYYLVHEHHLTLPTMARIAALYYSVDAASALATGWTSDAVIRRGATPGLVRKAAMVLGWSIAAGGFAACAYAGELHFLVWLVLTGIGVGMGNAGLFTFTQTLAGPNAVGKWVCVQNGLANLAGIVCPILTGYTVDRTGDFRLALTMTMGVCLIGALVWLVGVGPFRAVSWSRAVAQKCIILT